MSILGCMTRMHCLQDTAQLMLLATCAVSHVRARASLATGSIRRSWAAPEDCQGASGCTGWTSDRNWQRNFRTNTSVCQG